MWGGQFLDGIQFVYASTSPRDTADAVVHGPLVGNAATRNAAKIPTVVFDLWEDEYVAEVSGRKGAWTDGIKLRTNFGREVRCGGNGGGDFAIRLPPDSEVRAIAFNVGDHLTNPVAFVVDGAPSASVPPLKSSTSSSALMDVGCCQLLSLTPCWWVVIQVSSWSVLEPFCRQLQLARVKTRSQRVGCLHSNATCVSFL